MIVKVGDIDFSVVTDGLKGQLHKKVGQVALKHYKQGFKQGGGQTDMSSGGWAPRKNNVDPGRPILVKTKALVRSIRIKSSTRNRVIIGTSGISYASAHNYGTNIMPQREFLGDSMKLERMIVSEAKTWLDTLFKKSKTKTRKRL